MAYRLRVGLLLALGVTMLGADAAAQISSSRLKGVVRNSSGTAVPDARVSVLEVDSQVRMEILTDERGMYFFPAIPPGELTVTVDAKDFRQAVNSQVFLSINQTLELSFILEEVDPYGDPQQKSAGVLTASPDAQVARTFLKREIDLLPVWRNLLLNVAAYQPGVQTEGGSEALSRTNGTRQSSNNLTLDSMDVNDLTSPRLGLSQAALNADSITQFRIVTAGSKAEYGRNAGAQVMLVTRSGGSRWSGSAYDFLQNEVFNANDFFNNAVNGERPQANQNTFGFSLGGPIIRNRTSIFGNYEGSRLNKEIVRNRTVLTSYAKSGLFTWWPQTGNTVQTYNIVAHDPRGLGIDPQVADMLSLLPNPNNGDVGDGLNTAGYRFLNPIDGKENQFTIRIDHNLTHNHRIFYRHSWSSSDAVDWRNNADATFPGQVSGREKVNRWGFSLGSDWEITPLAVNEFRIGRQSVSSTLQRPARLSEPMMLSGLWTDPLNPDFPSSRGSRIYEIADHLTLFREEHVVKAGVEVRFARQTSSSQAGTYPDITFGTSYGNVPPSSIGPGLSQITTDERRTFEALYNALLGRMESVSQTFYSDLETFQPSGTARTRDYAFREFGAFLQDDWRLQKDFSISFGVRFDFSSVPAERNGLQGVLDQATEIGQGDPIGGFSVQSGGAWYKSDYENVAPRVGFTWNPRGDGTLTIRGGYGAFFDRLPGAVTNFVDANTPGFTQKSSLFPNLALRDVRLSDGIPLPAQPVTPTLTPPATRSTTAAIFDPELRNACIRQLTLTIQKELYHNTIVEAGYVGTRGIHLFQNVNLNQLKIEGDFFKSFTEIQAFRNTLTPVPASNTLVRIFGSVAGAVNALGGDTFDNGLVGAAADRVDRVYFGRYPAVGLSNYYLRDFPQFDKLIMGTDRGQSYYDSLQLRLRYRSRALNVEAGYTWSKSLDTISGDGGEYEAPIDNVTLSMNKARGDADRPHVVSTAIAYDLAPAWSAWLSNQPRWVGEIAGGWQVGVLTLWERGLPFTITSGRRTTGSDADSWVDYAGDYHIGEVIRSTYGVYYYYQDQILQFTFPAAGSTGNAGRNSFRGPDYFKVDLSLVKQFRVRETHTIALRIELYNLFNTTNFGLPAVNLSSPANFGRIDFTTGTPRTIQAALRYSF